MPRTAIAFATIALVIVWVNSAAWAQEFDAGKLEYQMGCAACHGTDGKGGGPVSSQLKAPPPDLTILAKKNNGVFPFNSVYEVIDGRKVVIAHDTRDMPIWGDRFNIDFSKLGTIGVIPATADDIPDKGGPVAGTTSAPEVASQPLPPHRPNRAAAGPNTAESFVGPSAYDPEIIGRTRILAVIDYLNPIQEK